MNVNRLKELLNYDESTGIFTHKKRRSGVPVAGAKAGCRVKNLDGGIYEVITLDRKSYKAHRLAWLYCYGSMPAMQIDHCNGDSLDNRICNLRDVSPSENCKNRTLITTNKTGVNGVSWNKKESKYQVTIMHERKNINLGMFDNLEDAKEARAKGDIKYNYHASHGRDKGVGHDAAVNA